MPDSNSVLMVSSEADPIVKVGGLADAVSALSVHLRAQGFDVRLLLPNYRECEAEPVGRFPIGPVSLGPHRFDAEILSAYIGEVPVYLLDIPQLYDRAGVYGPRIDQAFPDNLLRYGALCAVVGSLCRTIQWQPGIVHGHDWQSGLLPCLNQAAGGDEPLRKHFLTIHNIGYQGSFPVEGLSDIGISRDTAEQMGLIHNHRLNLLAGGISSSDAFSTVSETYSREIQQDLGFGLENIVRRRAAYLTGITNGTDYREWNPAADRYLPARFDTADMGGKRECKRLLQQEFSLPESGHTPLIGMVSRLVTQKGIEELADPAHGILQRLCREGKIQLVILGAGEQWCEDELLRLSALHRNLGVKIGFDTPLSHRIAAGSDFFLMPSRYEPCGLSQLYAMRYGSLPLATKTGGIADTVVHEETGFLFPRANPQAIYDSIECAIQVYHALPEQYAAMQQKAMRQRFTWEQSAKRYADVYRRMRA
ncbi:MAG: glycogen synthase [Spirochaeta sp.]